MELVTKLRELNEKMQEFADLYQRSDNALKAYPFDRDFMEIVYAFNEWAGAQNE